MKENEVYVCYEINRHDLAGDYGVITNMHVIRNKEDVSKWILERLRIGVSDGFVIDEENETFAIYGSNKVFENEKVMELLDNGLVYVTMFSSYQENWEECYDIFVEKKIIE